MTIRLNKVTRDLNVGITTAVEFLQKKGFTVEPNPNTKITDEQYQMLVKEFSTDKDLKMKSERFIQERQSKDRNKGTVSIDGFGQDEREKSKPEEIKTVVPEDVRPKFKQVGKIDLDKVGHKTVEEKPAVEEQKPIEVKEEVKETVEVQPAPVAEAPKEEPVKETVEVQPAAAAEPEPVQPVAKPEPEAKKEEPAHEAAAEEEPAAPQQPESKDDEPATEEKDGIFKIRQPELVSKINVIGQIDLAALNQSTRPKKKSKEEKRREREEKEKQRQDQKKQMKDAFIKEIRRDDCKL